MTDAERQQRRRDVAKEKRAMNKFMTVPMPADRTALMEQRKITVARNINDYVEDAFVLLYDNATHPLFVKLLEAVEPGATVEGSIVDDESSAAAYLRSFAKTNKIPMVPEAKLSTLRMALRVVMRRYHVSRAERRITVAGELVDARQGDLLDEPEAE